MPTFFLAAKQPDLVYLLTLDLKGSTEGCPSGGEGVGLAMATSYRALDYQRRAHTSCCFAAHVSRIKLMHAVGNTVYFKGAAGQLANNHEPYLEWKCPVSHARQRSP